LFLFPQWREQARASAATERSRAAELQRERDARRVAEADCADAERSLAEERERLDSSLQFIASAEVQRAPPRHHTTPAPAPAPAHHPPEAAPPSHPHREHAAAASATTHTPTDDDQRRHDPHAHLEHLDASRRAQVDAAFAPLSPIRMTSSPSLHHSDAPHHHHHHHHHQGAVSPQYSSASPRTPTTDRAPPTCVVDVDVDVDMAPAPSSVQPSPRSPAEHRHVSFAARHDHPRESARYAGSRLHQRLDDLHMTLVDTVTPPLLARFTSAVQLSPC